MTPEVRLSPDESRVAIKHDGWVGWVAAGATLGALTDDEVADWTPLVPAPPKRVTCPWCKGIRRKVTKTGRLYSHGQPGVFPPQHCKGSGRRPSDFEAIAAAAKENVA